MAEEEKTKLTGQEIVTNINDRLEDLENLMTVKFDKLKKVIEDYFTLGNEFARSSLITALKNI